MPNESLPAPTLPDLEKHKQDRAKLKLIWLTDPAAQIKIYQRCKGSSDDVESIVQGFIFWANYFTWAHDEFQPPAQRVRPVYLWDFQVEIAREIITNVWRCANSPIGEWNAYGEKGRRTAWTFTNLLILQYLWQFHSISSVITSKTEEDVDRKGDMNTPFEKLRFQIELQPRFLLPEGFSTEDKEGYKTRLIAIPNGGSQIAGLQPRGKAMRQARALIWFGDEFPHTENDYELWDAACGTVRVRIVGGTPNTPDCKAYKIRFNKDGENAHLFIIPWWEHPENAQGLFKKEDGSYSSPWFEEQLANKSKQTIAREYLMDWSAASGARVFHMFRPNSCWQGLPLVRGPVYRVWDPGLCFAVVWGQVDEFGAIRFLRELVAEDRHISSDTLLNYVARQALRISEADFQEFEIVDIGDPYASRKQIASQVKTEYELLQENFKIRVQSAFMFEIPAHERVKKRIEILSDKMSQDIEGTGRPGLLIDPVRAPILYEAFSGAYSRVVTPRGEILDEIARNHPINDVVDCAGMLALKAFYSTRNTTGPKVAKPRMSWRRGTTRRNSAYG